MSEEQKQEKPQKSGASPQPPSKGSNTIVIIIIVIVAVLIVLGVGGYFSWKYFISKYFASKPTPGASSQNTTSAAFTLSGLEDMLKYPNGTLTSTSRSKSAGSTSELQMETNDALTTVNNYYLNLNSASKWTVTEKSLESDNSRADIKYEGTNNEFTVKIVLDNYYEKTTIYIDINAENLPEGTPLGSNSITPTSKASASPTLSPSATSSSNSGLKSGETPANGYMIPGSDSRLISDSEIRDFTPWQLKIARNEIYARHGRPFVHKDLQCYFATQNWYKEDSSFSETELSVLENKNIATIKNFEEKINSPLLSKDTGC